MSVSQILLLVAHVCYSYLAAYLVDLNSCNDGIRFEQTTAKRKAVHAHTHRPLTPYLPPYLSPPLPLSIAIKIIVHKYVLQR